MVKRDVDTFLGQLPFREGFKVLQGPFISSFTLVVIDMHQVHMYVDTLHIEPGRLVLYEK